MKKVFLIFVAVIGFLSLVSCDFVVDDTPSINEHGKQYEIYLLAQEAGYTGTYEEWLESIKGEKGEPGSPGNGISSIEKTSTEGLVDTYTITFTDGTTTTFTVTNGEQGVSISKVEFNNLGQLVITLSDGTVLDPIDLPKQDEHSHSFTDWDFLKEPTCEEKGIEFRFCVECNDSQLRFIDKLDHNYDGVVCKICGNNNPLLEKFQGKTVSILGDSISTYTGVSNNSSVNSTLSNSAIYYTPGRWDVYQEDTWWQQTIDALGMKLLVNNSWSGSCVLHTRHNTVGAYIDRCMQLHNEFTKEEPDIIFVFISANDFSYFQDTLGDSNINYKDLISQNEDGTYTYKTPTTSCEAYAIMLHKMKNRYPNAQVYCLTSLARRFPDKDDGYADVGQPTEFNKNIMNIADYFRCNVIDLEKCGIEKESEIFDLYIADGRTHPNKYGMDLITEAICSNMLETNAKLCDIEYELNNVILDNKIYNTLFNNSYYTNLQYPSSYNIEEAIITMNGIDITNECFDGKTIYIKNVTGDLQINVIASRGKYNFSWELINGSFVTNDNNNNIIEKISGSINDGMITEGLFNLSYPVELKHDSEWVIEWKCSGNWRGALFSSAPYQTTDNMIYITRTVGGMVCIGTYVNGKYHNYGIDMSYLDNESHDYQLVNKITENGNMIYLYVDGIEKGPMNNYFIGSQNQNENIDWVSGKDFAFSYIGITGHSLNNCKLEYLKVVE